MGVGAIGTAVGGMRAASLRLDAAASNLANAASTGTPPDAAGRSTAYAPVAVRTTATADGAVRADVVPRNPAYEIRFAPDDPDAGSDGTVAAPAVDVAVELTDVLRARQHYAAAAKVVAVANDMMHTTLDALT